MLKCINKILHPNPKRIQADPNELNLHFNSTAQRLVNSNPTEIVDLLEQINALPGNVNVCFEILTVSYEEVLTELNPLR